MAIKRSAIIKQTNTLDEKHSEMLNSFYDIESNQIPMLIEKKKRY